MNVFFTSDTHFGHAALINKGLRKIPKINNIDEFNSMMITRWNSVVAKHDTVYHLGDFAWHNPEAYRKALNGHIHLIEGNHDRLSAKDKKLFESFSKIKSVKVDSYKIYLCHYAMRVWNQSHHGSWHLYGHSHGSLQEDPHSLSFDVGVDCWNYRPVSFDQIKAKMEKKIWKPVDHHVASSA